MQAYVAALDLGTTSIRCLIFDRQGRIVAGDQQEHAQIYPRPGWVEHDPMEIWRNTCSVITGALQRGGLEGRQIAALGITNQRETTIVWERRSGKPFANAVVWQCTRSDGICRQLAAEGGQDRFRARTGLPVATYFSGPKIKWLLDHHPGLRRAAAAGDACFGTVESWIVWWLTGGPGRGAHITDVSNASRTMLLDLQTLEWDAEILRLLAIPRSMLPRIVPSIDPDTWGATRRDSPFASRVPVCGALGDQQAALVGQACFAPGEAKNTYGTGCFLLMNTGHEAIQSRSGLITTVGYQLRGQRPVYCLEGSIAIAGALVQWLRDNLGLIENAAAIEPLARSVEDSGGIYIVPAFSGLFAPHWRADARGVIAGLTRYVTKGHLARAVLEACAYQTEEIVSAMNRDAGRPLSHLKVDGGMVRNDLLLEIQADLLGVPVIRPRVTETTALGAAYAAGLAVGFWGGTEELKNNWQEDRRWLPRIDAQHRARGIAGWNKALARTLDWVD
jgi:glycerol kinase